jgi:hypothetical protein
MLHSLLQFMSVHHQKYCPSVKKHEDLKPGSFCSILNEECNATKGKQNCSCFYAQLKFANFFIWQQETSKSVMCNMVFNEDSKMGTDNFLVLWNFVTCTKVAVHYCRMTNCRIVTLMSRVKLSHVH